MKKLLISVAADRADDLVRVAQAQGAEAATIVGEVLEPQESCSLILRA